MFEFHHIGSPIDKLNLKLIKTLAQPTDAPQKCKQTKDIRKNTCGAKKR